MGQKQKLKKDMIFVLCNNCTPRQIDRYFNLAVESVSRYTEDEMKTVVQQYKSLGPEDATMKKVVFFVVLATDEPLRRIVCDEQHPLRKERLPLALEKQDNFFNSLNALSEQYFESQMDEETFLAQIKEAYDTNKPPSSLVKTCIKPPARRRSKKKKDTTQ